MAKSMLRAIDPDDKASVKGVGTLDLDGILGNLCEVDLTLNNFTFVSLCSSLYPPGF